MPEPSFVVWISGLPSRLLTEHALLEKFFSQYAVSIPRTALLRLTQHFSYELSNPGHTGSHSRCENAQLMSVALPLLPATSKSDYGRTSLDVSSRQQSGTKWHCCLIGFGTRGRSGPQAGPNLCMICVLCSKTEWSLYSLQRLEVRTGGDPARLA